VAPPNNDPAITIFAGRPVTIRGVSLNGVGTTNSSGILLGAGTILNVQNSLIQNFADDGILFEPSTPAEGPNSQLSILDTVISNANTGILIGPHGAANVVVAIDHVQVLNCTNIGIIVEPTINGASSTLYVELNRKTRHAPSP
jgi:hypothetical protein